MLYLWTKTLHVLFVISWMACILYLPRILVNVAMTRGQPAVQQHLLGMGGRLYRFGHGLFGALLVFGLLLWFGHLVWPYVYPNVAAAGWMHAKAALVLVLLGYFIATGKQLRRIQAGAEPRSQRFYRWYNELPLVLLLPILYLVIAKPF